MIKRGCNKRAQMKLSFGMIFSIILIIIFIAFAFYGIKKFINIQQDVQIKKFVSDFQDDIDTMWKSSRGSKENAYSLPNKVKEVCFSDGESFNLQFISSGFIPPEEIEHINLEKTLDGKTSLCVPNIDGEVKLLLEKDFGENSVTISRNG